MKPNDTQRTEPIAGNVEFPDEWTVFAPFDGAAPAIPDKALRTIPEKIEVSGKTVKADRVTPTRSQLDFKPFFGEPPYNRSQAAYVFVPLHTDADQQVTLGLGADWYLQVWLNGEPVFDTLKDGNGVSPTAINNHLVNVRLSAGQNVLAVRLINGIRGAILAMAGPEELRRGDFRSILPPPDRELDAVQLLERYAPDPQAPLQWRMPDGFDPREPGLGLPTLDSAEHVELLHCHKSKAPLDEGGNGVYESLEHGTWNHNISPLVHFQDRLIGVWHNHSLDENGPGSRVLARVGKVVNDRGEVNWSPEGSLIEPAPAPVPVRRRKLQSDRDAVRGAQATGTFFVINDRLFFCGQLGALHGVHTDPDPTAREEQIIPKEYFYFGKGPDAPTATFARWDLGFRFYQEWAVRDDRLQPVSSLYKENDLPATLQLTADLALPLEPLVAPYSDAPLLSTAPPDFRELVLHGQRKGFDRLPQHRPGTSRLAQDGNSQVAPGHGSQFRRADGGWTAIMENKASKAGPFFYGAERADSDSYYPPARRTNLFGGVKPAAGELPDGRNYIVYNSPNRQNMVLTLSVDGRTFERSWLLMYRRLHNFTPGAMKNEGSAGAGPQYFKATVLGESLWIIYSISKEHVGATRIPLSALHH